MDSLPRCRVGSVVFRMARSWLVVRSSCWLISQGLHSFSFLSSSLPSFPPFPPAHPSFPFLSFQAQHRA